MRTTISIPVEQAAVAALAGRLGGVAALNPRTGEILALRRDRVLRPAAAGLDVQDHHADRRAGGQARQPVAHLSRADEGDARGRRARERQRRVVRRHARRTPSPSPATRSSRRSAPSSAAKRLVRRARALRLQPSRRHPRRGDEHDPAGRARSATTSRVGSTAIGQGRVQATALQMASVAATIGLRGRRPRVTLDARHVARGPRTTRATTARASPARSERLMLAVVAVGTGTRGGDPGRAASPARPAPPSSRRPSAASPTPRTSSPARPTSRPTTRPTPTPGSRPTPRRARPPAHRGRRAARAAPARAATPPRRWRRACSARR